MIDFRHVPFMSNFLSCLQASHRTGFFWIPMGYQRNTNVTICEVCATTFPNCATQINHIVIVILLQIRYDLVRKEHNSGSERHATAKTSKKNQGTSREMWAEATGYRQCP
jgi:hypothetical protein